MDPHPVPLTPEAQQKKSWEDPESKIQSLLYLANQWEESSKQVTADNARQGQKIEQLQRTVEELKACLDRLRGPAKLFGTSSGTGITAHPDTLQQAIPDVARAERELRAWDAKRPTTSASLSKTARSKRLPPLLPRPPTLEGHNTVPVIPGSKRLDHLGDSPVAGSGHPRDKPSVASAASARKKDHVDSATPKAASGQFVFTGASSTPRNWLFEEVEAPFSARSSPDQGTADRRVKAPGTKAPTRGKTKPRSGFYRHIHGIINDSVVTPPGPSGPYRPIQSASGQTQDPDFNPPYSQPPSSSFTFSIPLPSSTEATPQAQTSRLDSELPGERSSPPAASPKRSLRARTRKDEKEAGKVKFDMVGKKSGKALLREEGLLIQMHQVDASSEVFRP